MNFSKFNNIYHHFCPIKKFQNCCRLFSQKFIASHKSIPESIPDLEKAISGSKRAKKIARRVNQSETLKDFHGISPRLSSFIEDLRQEKFFLKGLFLKEFWIKFIPSAKVKGDRTLIKVTLNFWMFFFVFPNSSDPYPNFSSFL